MSLTKTTLHVTCIVPDQADPDRRIDAIGGDGFQYRLDDAIRKIELGTHAFWTTQNGRSVWIVVAVRNGRKYLKTEADGIEPNNLLALARC